MRRTTFAAALTALLIILTPTTAPATAAANTAQSGTITWWSGTNFTGWADRTLAPPANSCWTLSNAWRSVNNDTDLTLQLFTDLNCRIPLILPPAGLVRPHNGAPNMDPFPVSYMLCPRPVCTVLGQ